MKVRLTLRAEADLRRIAEYIRVRSPAGARSVQDQLAATFEPLAAYPYAGEARRRGVRRFALPRYPYLIFYGVDPDGQEVQVFTIRHAARRAIDRTGD